MALLTRTIVGPPQEWVPSAESGKLPGTARIVASEVTYDSATGAVRGKPLNHYLIAELKADGTWGLQFDPWGPAAAPGAAPIAPPSDEQYATAWSFLAEAAAHFGIIDHTLPNGDAVTYERGEDGLFARKITPQQAAA